MTDMTYGTIGYVDETTFAVRVREGTVANTVTKAFGVHLTPIPLPLEKPTVIKYDKQSSFDPAALSVGKKEVNMDLEYILVDGRELYYAIGTRNGTTSPITYTGKEPSAGATLPSRTLHMEVKGLADPKYLDIIGSVTEQIDIGWSSEKIGLMIKEKFVSQRITDEDATHDTDGTEEAGHEAGTYTAAPAYRDTTVTEETQYYLSALSFQGGSIIDDVLAGNIRITNKFNKNYSVRTTVDNYNRSINRYVSSFIIEGREYAITLELKPTDNAVKFLDAIRDNKADNALVITFSKTVASNTLAFTFDATTCLVTDLTGLVDFGLDSVRKWTMVLQPKTLTSLIDTFTSA